MRPWRIQSVARKYSISSQLSGWKKASERLRATAASPINALTKRTRDTFEYTMSCMSFSRSYLDETVDIVRRIDDGAIDRLATALATIRDRGGRLFILGVGGSAGHASHAVNDFRKICQFEAYTPTDNVSELTARVNDEGWESCFAEWLKGSRIGAADALLVFSVGGGNVEKNVSVNLVRAIDEALVRGARVFGIVGKDGGYARKASQTCVVIPVVSPDRITAHTEGLCAVIWHLLVSHPALKVAPTKWESVEARASGTAAAETGRRSR